MIKVRVSPKYVLDKKAPDEAGAQVRRCVGKSVTGDDRVVPAEAVVEAYSDHI
jgi:hypothetical protein